MDRYVDVPESEIQAAITRHMQYRQPPIVRNAGRIRRALDLLFFGITGAVAVTLFTAAIL